MTISIVIPVQNEADNIPPLVRELDHVFHQDKDVEIIFVNDFSTDDTPVLLEKFLASSRIKNYKVIDNEGKKGQSFALKAGFTASTGEYLVRMDGDLQDRPADALRIIDELRRGHDLVVGLRAIRSHSRLNRVQSHIFDTLSIALLDSPFHSSVASMAGFKRNLIVEERFGRQSNRFLILMALRNGVENPSEIFVNHDQRISGRSKYTPLKKALGGTVGALFFLITEMARRFFWRAT